MVGAVTSKKLKDIHVKIAQNKTLTQQNNIYLLCRNNTHFITQWNAAPHNNKRQ